MRELAFDLLHPLANQSGLFASHQKVRVVGSQTVTEDLHRKMVQTLPNNLPVTVAVFSKFEEELTIMTAMGQVIESSRQKVAIGSGPGREYGQTAKFLQRKKRAKNWL